MKYLLKDQKSPVEETRDAKEQVYQKYENLHDSDIFIEDKLSQKSQSSQQQQQQYSLSPYKYMKNKRQKSVKICKSPKEPATPNRSPNRHNKNSQGHQNRASAQRQSKSMIQINNYIANRNQQQMAGGNNSDKENSNSNVMNVDSQDFKNDRLQLRNSHLAQNLQNETIDICEISTPQNGHINLVSQSCGSDDQQSLTKNGIQSPRKCSLIQLHEIKPLSQPDKHTAERPIRSNMTQHQNGNQRQQENHNQYQSHTFDQNLENKHHIQNDGSNGTANIIDIEDGVVQNNNSNQMSTQSELQQSQESNERQELNAFMWKFLKQTNRFYMEQSIVHNIGKDIKYSIEKDDFLRQLADKSISPSDRKSLIFWLMELKKNYNFQDQTIMATIIYCDRYIQKNKFVERKVYQLIMIVCLIIAVKNYEDVVLTYEQGSQICGNVFSQEMIAMVERDILEKLDFQLNHPTSLDFILQILLVNHSQTENYMCQYHATNDPKCYQSLDHINITIQRCIPLIYMCQKDYETNMRNSQLTIALASMTFVIYEQAMRMGNSYQYNSIGWPNDEYLKQQIQQRLLNASTMVNYILQMVKRVFTTRGNNIHGLTFEQIFDTSESLFKFLQERSLNKKVQSLETMPPLLGGINQTVFIDVDSQGNFRFAYEKFDIYNLDKPIEKDQAQMEKPREVRQAAQNMQEVLEIQQTDTIIMNQVDHDLTSSFDKPQSQCLLQQQHDQQNQCQLQQYYIDEDMCVAPLNSQQEIISISDGETTQKDLCRNDIDQIIDIQCQKQQTQNSQMVTSQHNSSQTKQRIHLLTTNTQQTIIEDEESDPKKNLTITSNCYMNSNQVSESDKINIADQILAEKFSNEQDNFNLKSQISNTKYNYSQVRASIVNSQNKILNGFPCDKVQEILKQNKSIQLITDKNSQEGSKLGLQMLQTSNKNHIFRNSASPDESTVATHYMRSQYGSPEELDQIQKGSRKTNLIEPSSNKKSPPQKDLVPHQKMISKEKNICQTRGKSSGHKASNSSNKMKQLIRNLSREKINRALQLKLQQSSNNSKRSRISKDSNTCTQKTLSLSKMKQYSSNKKSGNCKLRKYLNANCDDKIRNQKFDLIFPPEKQVQSATKKQLYQTKLGFNFKKKENRRIQNRLRLAIQRQETRDNEDKAKTAAKIFLRNQELSVSPLDFDSALHGNNRDQEYQLKPNPHDLENMNVSSFDVQDSARGEVNKNVMDDTTVKSIDENMNQMMKDTKQAVLNIELTEIQQDEFLEHITYQKQNEIQKNCRTTTNKGTQGNINFDGQQVVIDLMEDSKKSDLENTITKWHVGSLSVCQNNDKHVLPPTTASDKYSNDKSTTQYAGCHKQSLIQSSQPSISQFQVNGLSSHATGNSAMGCQKDPKDFKKIEEQLQRIKNVQNIDVTSILSSQLLSPKNLANKAKQCKLQSLFKGKDESPNQEQ